MENTINERISIIVESLNITANAFAQELDVAGSVVYNIIKGRNKPSFDLIEKIIKVFDVNPDYIMMGDGKMFKTNDNKQMIKEEMDEKYPFWDKIPHELFEQTIKSKERSDLLDKLFKVSNINKVTADEYMNVYLNMTIINEIIAHYRINNSMISFIDEYFEKKIDFSTLKKDFSKKNHDQNKFYEVIEPYQKIIEEIAETFLKFDQDNDDIYA